MIQLPLEPSVAARLLLLAHLRLSGGPGSGPNVDRGSRRRIKSRPPKMSIGQISHDGSIESKEFDSLKSVNHVEIFNRRASASQKFRYQAETVHWDDWPSKDDRFSVEDHYDRLGLKVRDHRVLGHLIAAGGPGSGPNPGQGKRSKIGDGITARRQGDFDFKTLGFRRFMYGPESETIVFGKRWPQGAPGVWEDIGASHSEEFQFAKQDHGVLGHFDQYVKGWINPPTERMPGGIIEIQAPDGQYLPGGSSGTQLRDVDANQAAVFDAIHKTIEQFVKAGATRQTVILATGFRGPLGEQFPHLFKKPRNLGGAGSGNFDHAGRPGEVGGSGDGDDNVIEGHLGTARITKTVDGTFIVNLDEEHAHIGKVFASRDDALDYARYRTRGDKNRLTYNDEDKAKLQADRDARAEQERLDHSYDPDVIEAGIKEHEVELASRRPETTTFYHGTSSEALRKIKTEGLLPGRGEGADAWAEEEYEGRSNDFSIGDRKASVFITSRLDQAVTYSEYAEKITGSRPIILAIEVPQDQLVNLKPDEMSEGKHAWRTNKGIPPTWILGQIKKTHGPSGGKITALAVSRVFYFVIPIVETELRVTGGPGSGPNVGGGSRFDDDNKVSPVRTSTHGLEVKCAWCKKDMGWKKGPFSGLVSHGMCDDCVKAFDAPEPKTAIGTETSGNYGHAGRPGEIGGSGPGGGGEVSGRVLGDDQPTLEAGMKRIAELISSPDSPTAYEIDNEDDSDFTDIRISSEDGNRTIEVCIETDENDDGDSVTTADLALIDFKTPVSGVVIRQAIGEMFQALEDTKVDYAQLRAGLQDGGYLWARMGFRAENPKDFVKTVEKNLLEAEARKVTPEQVAQIRKLMENPTPKLPQQIADLKIIGKRILRGTDWLGKVKLSSPQFKSRRDHYLGRNKQELLKAAETRLEYPWFERAMLGADDFEPGVDDEICDPKIYRIAGGSGSGNFQHSGRPGEVGGSGEGAGDSKRSSIYLGKSSGKFKISKKSGDNIKKVDFGSEHYNVDKSEMAENINNMFHLKESPDGYPINFYDKKEQDEMLSESQRIASALVADASKDFDIRVIPYQTGISVEYVSENTSLLRSFSRGENNELVAHHDFFETDKQGAGLAKEILRSSFAEYEKLGVDKVELTANRDVGRYAWAKYGFVPEDHETYNVYKSALQVMEAEPEKGILLEQLIKDTKREMKSERPNPEHIWKIADHVDGFKWLAGSSDSPSWEGKLSLKNERQMERLAKYLDTKSKPHVADRARRVKEVEEEGDDDSVVSSYDEMPSPSQPNFRTKK